MKTDIIYGLADVSLYLSDIGKYDFMRTVEDACSEITQLRNNVKALRDQEAWRKVEESVPNGDSDVDVWVCCVDSDGNKNVHRAVFYSGNFFDEGGWTIRNATHWKYREGPDLPKEGDQK